MGTAQVKVRIVTRVRVSAESGQKRNRTRCWYAIVILTLGLSQAAYRSWAYWSYSVVAPVYHASESCRLPSMDSLQPPTAGP